MYWFRRESPTETVQGATSERIEQALRAPGDVFAYPVCHKEPRFEWGQQYF